jgi:hypothetical protein
MGGDSGCAVIPDVVRAAVAVPSFKARHSRARWVSLSSPQLWRLPLCRLLLPLGFVAARVSSGKSHALSSLKY